MLNLTTNEQRGILILLFAVILFAGVKWYRSQNVSSIKIIDSENKNQSQLLSPGTTLQSGSTKQIAVHVSGAVSKPGLYYLPENSRMVDAIKMAGDTTALADITYLNYASLVMDGEKIEVPFRTNNFVMNSDSTQNGNSTNMTMNNSVPNVIQPAPQPILRFNSPSVSRKININTASIQELDTLPGIGPALAQRIIDYRNQRGYYRRIEQVLEVRGIGEKRFEDIRDKITVQ